jgi:hypothetical protein
MRPLCRLPTQLIGYHVVKRLVRVLHVNLAYFLPVNEDKMLDRRLVVDVMTMTKSEPLWSRRRNWILFLETVVGIACILH